MPVACLQILTGLKRRNRLEAEMNDTEIDELLPHLS